MTIGSDEFDHRQMQARFEVLDVSRGQIGKNQLAGFVVPFGPGKPSDRVIDEQRFEFDEIREAVIRSSEKRIFREALGIELAQQFVRQRSFDMKMRFRFRNRLDPFFQGRIR